MDDLFSTSVIRERIERIVIGEFGRADEELAASGILDSLKSVSLALLLEREFDSPLRDISVADMATMSQLCQKIHSILARLPREARRASRDGDPVIDAGAGAS